MTLPRRSFGTRGSVESSDPTPSKAAVEDELRAMIREQRSGDGQKPTENDDRGLIDILLGTIVNTAMSVKLPEGDISDGWDSGG